MSNWYPDPLVLNIKGKLSWPFLTSVNTKFNDDGMYEANVVVPEEEAQQYIDKIEDFREKMLLEAREAGVIKKAAKVKEGSMGYQEQTDPETGEPTGNIVFKASRLSKGTTKAGKDWTLKVPLFDAKGVPISDIESIYGGTEAVVRVAITPYYTAALGFGMSTTGKVPSSIKKGLLAVQIIKLVAGGDNEESFGAVEGGYEHTPSPSTGTNEESFDEATVSNVDHDVEEEEDTY